MDYTNLRELARAAMSAKKGAAVAYSYGDEKFSTSELNETLRNEFKALTATAADYRENKNVIFRLIEETIDEVLPKRVEQLYEQFADVRTVAQGDAAIFRTRITEASRKRAKTFVTRVGLAGRYETFKLDGTSLEIKTGAIGAAARLEFEEFLDGRWDFADFTSCIVEGMDEFIYQEIAKALAAVAAALPRHNRAVVAGFDEDTMDELVAIADAYDHSAIYCTFEFASKMLPKDAWLSNDMKNQRWNTGYLGNYKGHQVIILPQSITDGSEVNDTKVIDPSMAYIIPTGVERPVKVVFEGQTHVREVTDNDDWSSDIQTYRKVGIGVLTTQNWICTYKNSNLSTASRSHNLPNA